VRHCIESLLKNSYQALHLHLITDSNEDELRLIEVMDVVHTDKRHRWDVVAEIKMLDREATIFRGFGNLRTFRTDHACWREITDPLLLS
jgi:hypothetical protein